MQIANEIAAAKILAGRSIYTFITQFLQKKLNLAWNRQPSIRIIRDKTNHFKTLNLIGMLLDLV